MSRTTHTHRFQPCVTDEKAHVFQMICRNMEIAACLGIVVCSLNYPLQNCQYNFSVAGCRLFLPLITGSSLSIKGNICQQLPRQLPSSVLFSLLGIPFLRMVRQEEKQKEWLLNTVAICPYHTSGYCFPSGLSKLLQGLRWSTCQLATQSKDKRRVGGKKGYQKHGNIKRVMERWWNKGMVALFWNPFKFWAYRSLLADPSPYVTAASIHSPGGGGLLSLLSNQLHW